MVARASPIIFSHAPLRWLLALGVKTHVDPDAPAALATSCQSGLSATARLDDAWSAQIVLGTPTREVNFLWVTRNVLASYPGQASIRVFLEDMQVYRTPQHFLSALLLTSPMALKSPNQSREV